MSRTVGTTVRSIRTPIIRNGDDLVSITVNSVLACQGSEGFEFHDKDIVGITEAVLARAQGNYAGTAQIAADIKRLFPTGTAAVVFPILSRNRFAVCLKGIAAGLKKMYLALSYPSDEVGNALFDPDMLDDSGVNPYSDVLNEQGYRERFGYQKHPFTGVDYVEYYKSIVQEQGCEVEILFMNDPRMALAYTKDVLVCEIHGRARSKRLLNVAGANSVYGLDDVLNAPVDGSGYNEEYGLLGSNKATEDVIKLFPRDCQAFVDAVAASMKDKTGQNIEVMIYGDGAFKDSVGKIWELADPVVSPAYTKGIEGTPNELKLKFLADNQFAALKGDELLNAIRGEIRTKDENLVGNMLSEGTTPRKLSDLIGSLCDLSSGSGDKGTPVILIQGYFDNLAKD